MTDLEDLLTRTLADPRRSLAQSPTAFSDVRAATKQLVRRRRTAIGAAAGGLVALVTGTALLLGGSGGAGVLSPSGPLSTTAAAPTLTATAAAAPTLLTASPRRAQSRPTANAQTAPGVPGQVTGVVSDEQHRPLANVRLMSLDLLRVLGRTRADGSFSASCRGLVLAPYAFGKEFSPGARRDAEPSPGLGNYAFRTLSAGLCGRRVAVTLPTGGVVEGRADARAGQTVVLSRVVGGNDADGTKRFGAFETTVREDGTYRIEGLATGRYSIESSYEGFPDEATFVDVHEGRMSDGSYTYYQDPAVCYENPDDPSCAQPSPTPRPAPLPRVTS